MPIFFLTGHVAACPAAQDPEHECSGECENKLFQLTGFLALVAGGVELLVGLIAASSFAVADAVHAFSDAFTDYYGAHAAKKARQRPENGRRIRRRASRVIAAALTIATIPIVVELLLHHGNLLAEAMMVAGGVPLVIHLARWHLFSQGHRRDPTETRLDLIRHVRTDALHSFFVLVAAISFKLMGGATFALLGSLRVGAEEIDNGLTVVLVCYMLWQAWRIGTGSGHVHVHDHHH